MKEAGTPITIGAYEDDHSEAGSVPEEREPVCSEFSGPSGSVVKNPSASSGDAGGRGFSPWVGKTPQRRKWQPTPVFLQGKIPWTEESGGLQSMGSPSIRHSWAHTHTQWVGKGMNRMAV